MALPWAGVFQALGLEAPPHGGMAIHGFEPLDSDPSVPGFPIAYSAVACGLTLKKRFPPAVGMVKE